MDNVGNASARQLLFDIEQVSKGLHIPKKSSNNVVSSPHQRSNLNLINEELLSKDKLSSIWKKSLKALTHIRSRRFNCWFFLHVHSIEGLPSNFNNANLCVYWKRKHDVMRTRPAKVSEGKVKFEETLMHKCSVYGSKNGHHHSAKYKPKLFLLYALVVEANGLDMGKHWIDVTKLLPLTLEELEDKKSSGKWTTSYKLAGRAKGGVLNVSFGFSVRRENLLELGNNMTIPKLLREYKSNLTNDDVDIVRDSNSGRLRRVGSALSNSKRYVHTQSESLDNTPVSEVILIGRSELARPVRSVSQNVGNSDLCSSHEIESFREYAETLERQPSSCHESSCENVEGGCFGDTFSITEQGVESSKIVQVNPEVADQIADVSVIESIDVKDIFKDVEISDNEEIESNFRVEDSSDNEERRANGDTSEVIVNGEIECNLRDEDYFDNKEHPVNGGIAEGTLNEEIKHNLRDESSSDKEEHSVNGDIDDNDTPTDEFTFGKTSRQNIEVSEIIEDEKGAVSALMTVNSIDEDCCRIDDGSMVGDTKYEGNDNCTKEFTIGKTDSSRNLSVSELGDPDSLSDFNDLDNEISMKNKPAKIVRSLSVDDVADSVANDFLKSLAMEKDPLDLGNNSDPESPREILLRQFEEEALASGGLILNFDSEDENVGAGSDSPSLPLALRVNDEGNDSNRLGLSLRIKKDAELLEYLETEALMKEWGFNEHAFQNSPHSSSGGFGSPIYIPAEESVDFPPLAEGLGSTVKTKDGGYLRSMNPLLFKNAKNGGKLIMQVSAPVVLPVAMGSTIMEILEHWASVGYEKMYIQVDELMPLEDISGKMLQQVAWEIASRSEATDRLPYLQQDSEDGNDVFGLGRNVKQTPFSWDSYNSGSSILCDDLDIEYVTFEGLSVLAMDRIETLSIEGLRIQSGMAGGEAPSIIKPQPFGEASAFLGKSIMAYGSPILEGIDRSKGNDANDLDKLISLSLKLDDWVRLDAGVLSEEDDIDHYKIIEAHLSESMELDKPLIQDNSTGRSCGLLGNNFTVALRVQLRDPLRDYEAVGEPMLSLVEVERVFLGSKPIIHCRVSENDELFSQVAEEATVEEKQKINEEATAMFKITEVHVAGFCIETVRKQNRAGMSQEHSGTRWLLASGMGQMKKLLHLKTNSIIRSYSLGAKKSQPKDTLWSISSHVHSPGARWKDLATSNVHIRNPDVIFVS